MLDLSFYVRVLWQTACAGETTGELRFRWNDYKCNNRKYTRNEVCFQEHLFRNFDSGEHTGFLENVKITLKPMVKILRKEKTTGREHLKHMLPLGLR